MVWHLEFRSELEISDYFNDSGKTSPNDRQILDGGKIASLLLADFMEFRFLLRICPRYIASLGHYWIAALGSQSKWPNSVGQMIELWSIWVAICLLRFWLSKKKEKMNRFYFFHRLFPNFSCTIWLYCDHVWVTILFHALKVPFSLTTNLFLRHQNEKMSSRTKGILLVTNFCRN